MFWTSNNEPEFSAFFVKDLPIIRSFFVDPWCVQFHKQSEPEIWVALTISRWICLSYGKVTSKVFSPWTSTTLEDNLDCRVISTSTMTNCQGGGTTTVLNHWLHFCPQPMMNWTHHRRLRRTKDAPQHCPMRNGATGERMYYRAIYHRWSNIEKTPLGVTDKVVLHWILKMSTTRVLLLIVSEQLKVRKILPFQTLIMGTIHIPFRRIQTQMNLTKFHKPCPWIQEYMTFLFPHFPNSKHHTVYGACTNLLMIPVWWCSWWTSFLEVKI